MSGVVSVLLGEKKKTLPLFISLLAQVPVRTPRGAERHTCRSLERRRASDGGGWGGEEGQRREERRKQRRRTKGGEERRRCWRGDRGGSGEADGETLNYSDGGKGPAPSNPSPPTPPPPPPPQHHGHIPGGRFEHGRLASPANGPQIDTHTSPPLTHHLLPTRLLVLLVHRVGREGGSYRRSLSLPLSPLGRVNNYSMTTLLLCKLEGCLHKEKEGVF